MSSNATGERTSNVACFICPDDVNEATGRSDDRLKMVLEPDCMGVADEDYISDT
jgi:hypothetical protein